jgi:hypothetical protein
MNGQRSQIKLEKMLGGNARDRGKYTFLPLMATAAGTDQLTTQPQKEKPPSPSSSRQDDGGHQLREHSRRKVHRHPMSTFIVLPQYSLVDKHRYVKQQKSSAVALEMTPLIVTIEDRLQGQGSVDFISTKRAGCSSCETNKFLIAS